MSAALTIALKDVRLLLRDRAALFWILVFPTLFALFLAAVMQTWSARAELALRVAAVDSDGSLAARDFLSRLARQPALRVDRLTLAEARARLRRGELDASIEILPGFGAAPDWYSGGVPVLRVEADPGRRREARYVQGLLLEVGLAEAVELELARDPRASIRLVESAGSRAPTAHELVTPTAVLWGLIGCAASFAISIAAERQRGTLRRLRSLPISHAQILGGKALACWGVSMVVALSILAAARLGVGVRCDDWLALCAALGSLALCLTGLMAMISTLGTSERSVAGAGWATLLLLSMVGGVMAPRMIMPDWLNAVGALSPVRWGLVALESALWRGGQASDWLEPCAKLALVGVAGLALGAFVLARSPA